MKIYHRGTETPSLLRQGYEGLERYANVAFNSFPQDAGPK